ncbi:MAG: sodium:calcium antiporter [Armatimonadetes bacterium]|nr:sodium:calcium antiporter [Armatimonadota bacterium]
MSVPEEDRESPVIPISWAVAALLLVLPWICARLLGIHPDDVTTVVMAGLSIVGAAFILSWAAELAQLEMSPALATVFLALVAVLPEYAIDLYYAWDAGKALAVWNGAPPVPEALGLPMANMTGANRLLIGMGWTMVVFIHCWRAKKHDLSLQGFIELDHTYLIAATLYSFVIAWKGSLSMLDCVIYVAMFAMYVRQAMRQPTEEPHLEGPAAMVGLMARGPRRVVNAVMFAFAGFAVFLAAEPFAEGLKHIGERFNIETFLLVQWLAPLASESPEFIVAALFAWRMHARMGFGALVSSKVNQWTLLVGMIPLATWIASSGHLAMPLDERQREELMLTAAQSVFAVAVLGNLRMSLWEALAVLVLFVLQLFMPTTQMRWVFSIVYVVLAVVVLASRREYLPGIRDNFVRFFRL